jgi:hypothetical protein
MAFFAKFYVEYRLFQHFNNYRRPNTSHNLKLKIIMWFPSLVPVFLFVTSKLAPDKQTRASLSSSALLGQKMYEVCLSPGCIADGAQVTLDKLQALAPPGVSVKPGVCCSLCGNGPVVLEGENKKHRRVSGKKLLDLLVEEKGDLSPQQQAIAEGYDLVTEAATALYGKDYSKAVQLYEEGIAKALKPAMDLQEAREQGLENGIVGDEAPCVPAGLEWLIKARQGEATARLQIGDSDGAVVAAQAACEVSRNSSPEVFELLHEVFKSTGDESGELSALQALFDLPEPEKLTTIIANKRRQLGFRLAKLERDVKR